MSINLIIDIKSPEHGLNRRLKSYLIYYETVKSIYVDGLNLEMLLTEI